MEEIKVGDFVRTCCDWHPNDLIIKGVVLETVSNWAVVRIIESGISNFESMSTTIRKSSLEKIKEDAQEEPKHRTDIPDVSDYILVYPNDGKLVLFDSVSGDKREAEIDNEFKRLGVSLGRLFRKYNAEGKGMLSEEYKNKLMHKFSIRVAVTCCDPNSGIKIGDVYTCKDGTLMDKTGKVLADGIRSYKQFVDALPNGINDMVKLNEE